MKITIKSALDMISLSKIYLDGEIDNIIKKLSSLGFTENKQSNYHSMPFMYIHDNLTYSFSNNMEEFIKSEYVQISVDKILNIQLIDTPEFNTGDYVLGMDGNGIWRLDIFSHITYRNNTPIYTCIGRSYTTCISFKDHESLVGTSN